MDAAVDAPSDLVAADAASPDALSDQPTADSPYPAGPYGANMGERLANIVGEGYPLSAAQSDRTMVPFRSIDLAEIRGNAACRCIVLEFNGSLPGRCPPCQMQERALVPAAATLSAACFVTVFVPYGAMAPDAGGWAPATRSQLDTWIDAFHPTFPQLLTTEGSLLQLGSPDAVPQTWVVEASSMRIIDRILGFDMSHIQRVTDGCAMAR